MSGSVSRSLRGSWCSLETDFQLLDDDCGGFGDGDFPAGLGCEASHGNAVEAAGGDCEKRRQALWGDVDREAMHGNPFPYANADGGELAVFHPDAGKAIAATGVHAEVVAGADEGVFEFAQVIMEVAATGIEVEDRVADELAGAVISRLAATVGFVKRVRKGGGIAEGRLVAQATDGVNGLVFEQENRVAAAAIKDGSEVLLLQVEAGLVVDGSGEMEGF